MAGKWEERREAIQRMVGEGKTDEEIGVIWDASGPTICEVRKRFGILSRSKRKSKPLNEVFAPQAPALEGETYTDEAGLTVTRYPARYADGLPPGVTARTKRG